MRILLAGDSHGNASYIENLLRIAEIKRCERVFVLGDFGYWPHVDWGMKFLTTVEEMIHDSGIFLDFIDGNHDNHPWLWSLVGEARRGQAKIGRSMYYHGRGQRWEWGGVQFMSLGGGYSVDKEYRTPWTSWWPTECLTDQDVTCAIRPGGVDIMLVHDSPGDVDLTDTGKHAVFKQGIAPSEDNRKILQRVINIKEPELVVHGHMHCRYDDTVRDGRTKVVGLAHDGDTLDRACIVLEVEDGTWRLG